MFLLLGVILILFGILGLVDLVGLGLVLSIIFIVIGLALAAYDRGAFRR